MLMTDLGFYCKKKKKCIVQFIIYFYYSFSVPTLVLSLSDITCGDLDALKLTIQINYCMLTDKPLLMYIPLKVLSIVNYTKFVL